MEQEECMKCPKCKIEAEIVKSSTRVTPYGVTVLVMDVICPKCGQKGHTEKVIGKSPEEEFDNISDEIKDF
jgi:C4-type Zn-finger protein